MGAKWVMKSRSRILLMALQFSEAYRELLFQLLPSHQQGMSDDDDKILKDQVSPFPYVT